MSADASTDLSTALGLCKQAQEGVNKFQKALGLLPQSEEDNREKFQTAFNLWQEETNNFIEEEISILELLDLLGISE